MIKSFFFAAILLVLSLVFANPIFAQEVPDASPSLVASVSPSLIPSSLPSTDPSPAPSELPSPSPSASPTSEPVSNIIQLNNTYVSPSNSKVSVKFTSLISNTGTISFNEVSLSDSQKQALGALSNAAYDISSSMPNGSFTYDLILPYPAGINGTNFKVLYASDVNSLSNGSQVGENITDNGDGTFTIHGLNHFTVFVVVNPNNQPTCDSVAIDTTPGSTCFATVQEAVDSATAGDTIKIGAGTYNETVNVNKSLTFQGVGTVTIDTMNITASPVNLNNIHVNNLNYPDSQAPVISDITLTNLTTGNNAKVKNTDSIRLTAKISDNNQSTITTSRILANFSAFGGGSAVSPSSYDSSTGIATWSPITVSGTTTGSVVATVNASDAAGNNAISQTSSMQADNQAPGQGTNLAITNPINNGNKTNISISGNGEVGATVNYTISNGAPNISGTTTVDNNGNFSVTSINVSTLPDGTLTLSVTLTDDAGNTSIATTATSTKDVVSPTTSDNIDNLWHNNSVQVTLSCDDGSGSGCNQIVYTTDGSDPITSPTRVVVNGTVANFTLGNEEVYTIKYYSIDNAGNQEATKTATNQVKIDLTKPTVSADNVIAGWFTSNPTITLSVSDSGGSQLNNKRYNWDSPATATVGTVFNNLDTINIPSDGIHTLYLYADDNGGNSSLAFSAVYRLDTVDPTVSATGSLASWQTSLPTITVSAADTLSGSDVSTVSYQWDGGVLNSTSNLADITASFPGDGIHTLDLIVTDVSGRTGTFQGTYMIDRVNPTDPGVPSTLTPTKLTTQVWNFVASTDLTSGIAQYVWRTMLGVIAGPSGTVGANATSVTTNLTEGVWDFFIKALDNAGRNSNEVSGTAMVDTTNPLTNDTGTDNLWHKNPVDVTLTCSDTNGSGCAQIIYTTDASDPVTSPTRVVISGTTTNFNLSSEGVYTIKYYSIDNAGNQEVIKQAANLVQIDTTPPTVSSDNVIAGWFTSNPSITLSVVDLGGSLLNNVRYAWDGVADAVTGTVFVNGATINIPSDGIHTLNIYADDNAGNQSLIYSAVYRLDTNDPTILATGSSAGWQTGIPTITVSAADTLPGSGVASVQYSWDGGVFNATLDGADLTATLQALGDGIHTLTINITDVAGRINQFSGTYMIDTVNPATSDNTDNLWYNIPVTVNLTCFDATSTCATTYYTIDGSTPTLASNQGTSIVLNADGVYTIKYFSVDVAGNVESVQTALNQVMIDMTIPVISGVSLANITTGNTNFVKDGDTVSLTAIVTDINNQNLLTVAMITADLSSLGGGAVVNPVSYDNLTGLATWATIVVSGSGNGLVTITVNANDVATNPAVSQNVTSTADNIAPTTADSGTDTNWHNTNVTVNLTCLDTSGSGCAATYYTTDGSTPTTSSASGNAVILTSDGIYTIKYFSIDNAGKQEPVKTALNTVKIDKTPASGSWTQPAANSNVSGTVNLTATVSDNLSGVASVTFQYAGVDNIFNNITTINNPTLPVTTTWDTNALTLDFYTLRLIITDASGNSINVDQVVGVATVITPQATAPVPSSNSITITWNTTDPATSRVIYDAASHPVLGSAPDYGYANSTPESDLGKVTSHSVTLTGLSAGTTYYYRMVSKGSPESVSGEFSFTTQASPPAQVAAGGTGGDGRGGAPMCTDAKPGSAPILLAAKANARGQITLSWSSAKDPVTYYLIEYGTKSGKYEFGVSDVGNVTTTTIGNLTPGTTYFFRVRAGNVCAPGEFSNELSEKADGGKVLAAATKVVDVVSGVLGATDVSAAEEEASPSSEVSESAEPEAEFGSPEPVLYDTKPKDNKPLLLVLLGVGLLGAGYYFYKRQGKV